MESEHKKALKELLKKYGVAYDPAVESVPLQSWRSNRRFVELFKLVDNNTIENVCLLRFSHMTDSKTPLESTLYREFDLCEYIGHGKVRSLHAVFTGASTGNVIVTLDNGVLASVEVGNLLPDGRQDLERHEIVARRGVANDLPMDVQIPLQSIYAYTADGDAVYRDVDFELYGFPEEEIAQIRAEFDFCRNTSSGGELVERHNHLKALVAAAFESNNKKQKLEVLK